MITNEKYKLLKESLKAIKRGDINILTLLGSAGMGKTYTTLKDLKEEKISYEYINSYATPLSFYKLLYKNRKKDVIIFDDLMGVSNPLVLSMLKAACWVSDGKRIVSYHSTSSKLDLEELPESFEFDTNVVLIFNKPIQGYEPITNRGITINFNFNYLEKIKIFEDLKVDAKIEEDVLDYIKLNCNDATKNLSVRTLVILSNLKRSGSDFKSFAKEILPFDEDKELLIKLSAEKWSETTGMHRATYFRYKKKYNLQELQSRTVAQSQGVTK